ncbi:MAG: hypothetical protein H5T83_06410 [Actinotalea sp.]|nr:hypothetical protein [Actinotalea sp.]
MNIVLLPVVGFAVLGLLLVAVVAVVLLLTSRPAPDPSQAATAARHHAGVVTGIAWTALVLTLLLGPAVAGLLGGLAEGVAYGLVPAVAGALFVGVHAIGELTWPRPTGSVRRAGLERRGTDDVAPRGLRRLLWGWTGLVAVIAVVGGTIATDGRQISRTFENGLASSGPFPGWFYGAPLLLACLVVLVATEGVLRVVASRSAVMDAQPVWDAALRRLSAHRVLRGAQLVVGLTAAGLLLTAGMALRNVGNAFVDDGAGSPLHSGAGAVAVALAVGVGLAALVVAVLPGRPAGQLVAPAGPLPAAAAPR